MFPSIDFLGTCVVSSCNAFLSVVLHGTMGSYLRDALHEAGAATVACLPSPRAQASVPVFFISLCTFFVLFHLQAPVELENPY
jgi:hypothetical protein